MAQKPAPLREQTRSVVRSLLARTALDLFAAKGYDNTTLEEVAAAAGVSRRTLFNYFRNKEDLALSGLSEQGDAIVARLAERPATEDAWTALRAAFQVLEEIDMTAGGRSSSSRSCSATSPCAPGTLRSRLAGKTVRTR